MSKEFLQKRPTWKEMFDIPHVILSYLRGRAQGDLSLGRAGETKRKKTNFN